MDFCVTLTLKLSDLNQPYFFIISHGLQELGIQGGHSGNGQFLLHDVASAGRLKGWEAKPSDVAAISQM